MVEIYETKDCDLLAALNEEVQMIHHEIEPLLFKPFNHEDVKKVFQTLLEKGAVAYVSKLDGKEVGYIILERMDRQDGAFRYAHSSLLIDQICVKTCARGHGIGKRLVDTAIDYARSQDLSSIEMNYWTKNRNSGEFFRHLGFVNFNECLSMSID